MKTCQQSLGLDVLVSLSQIFDMLGTAGGNAASQT